MNKTQLEKMLPEGAYFEETDHNTGFVEAAILAPDGKAWSDTGSTELFEEYDKTTKGDRAKALAWLAKESKQGLVDHFG